jgi:uncharacterized damage-inducible protein DinB
MEGQLTTKLLEALPADQYDFRPDPGGRSLGEMAWHLAEIEGYISYGITKGAVTFQEAPPNMKRPREIRLLAPGYRQVHEEAVARLANIDAGQLDREIPFADRRMPLRDVLWGAMLMHLIHHRGQLSLLWCGSPAAPRRGSTGRTGRRWLRCRRGCARRRCRQS